MAIHLRLERRMEVTKNAAKGLLACIAAAYSKKKINLKSSLEPDTPPG